MSEKIEVAVIPVAGLGTRWLPVTRSVPKELLPVWRHTAVSYAVRECLAAGIREIVFVSSPGKTEVAQYFEPDTRLVAELERWNKLDRLGDLPDLWERVTVRTAEQAEPLGLGHAVLCARDAVGERPFALLLPDEVLLAEPSATAQLVRVGAPSILLLEVPRSETHAYGIADLEDPSADVSRIRTMVEKPAPDDAPSTRAIIGRYVLSPDLFALLETQQAGHGGEIQLTDALTRLAAQRPVQGVRFGGVRHDVGQPLGLLLAAADIALDDPAQGRAVREGLTRILARTTPLPGLR